MRKNKRYLIPAVSLAVILLILGTFLLKYNDNSKIQSINSFDECAKAGYPVMESYPEKCRTSDGRLFTKPVSQQAGWREQSIEEIGLSLSYPSDLTFRKEIGDNSGSLHTVAFYIEKGDQTNPEYQLYGLFLADKEGSQQDLERSKSEMDPKSIKEATIAGYTGIEGLILGPKSRYITTILKDGRLLSVSTFPPTQENKKLTEIIIKSFKLN